MSNELQGIAEELGQRLHRSVAIDDPEMRLLAHAQQFGTVDNTRLESILRLKAPPAAAEYGYEFGIATTTKSTVRMDADLSRGFLSRICAPLRVGDHLLGYLWVIDEDITLTEEHHAIITEAARSAALVIQRDSLIKDLHASKERELLRDLLSHDDALRHSAALSPLMPEDFRGAKAVQAVVIGLPTGIDTAEEVELIEAALDAAARRVTTRRCMKMARHDHALIVVPATRGKVDLVARIAIEARAELEKALRTTGLRSGRGDSVASIGQVLGSYTQARRSLKVGEVVAGFPVDVSWRDLGVYRLLINLQLDDLPDGVIPPQLTALADTPVGMDLMKTVETYLDNAADVQSTIADLSIHRTTLYQRLARFTTLTGLDLRDGGDRLSVHLGLKLAKLLGPGATGS